MRNGLHFFCLKVENFLRISATKCIPTKKNLGKIWKMKHLNSRVYCGSVSAFCAIHMQKTCSEQEGTENTGEVEMLFKLHVIH